MFMFINKKIILIYLFFMVFFISCTKKNTFEFYNVLGNIASTPEEYLDNSNYQCVEITRNSELFPKYAISYGYESIFKVTNDEIVITYWKTKQQYQIQMIVINKKTSLNSLSKFIDKDIDEILKSLKEDTIYELSNSELRFDLFNYQYFILFKHRNKKIYQIIIGKNL